MKTLLASLACVTLWIGASTNASAQGYDTCAPHRHGLYGYSSGGHIFGGGGFGGGYGRGIRGPVRPFQGLVNPRYLHPTVEYVVVAQVDPAATQPQVYLPREIRERKQAEMEIASDSDLLRESEQREPARSRPSQYESPAAEGNRPQAPAPPRIKVPQPELVAARTTISPGRYSSTSPAHPMSPARPMTSAAADEYMARSAAALARLKARRTEKAPQGAVAEATLATTATDGTHRN